MGYPSGASGYGSAGSEPPAAGGERAASGGARGPIWLGSALVAGLGVLNFLFGFLPYVKIEGITQLGGSDTTRTFFQFQTVTPLAFLLLGGVLAGVSLLPKQNWRAPAAAASIVGWLVLLFQSFSLDDGLGLGIGGYAVLVLGFVQAVLATLLLTVEVGMLKAPAGRPARRESGPQSGGQYPSSYGSTPGYERPAYGSGYGQQYGQPQPGQGPYGQSQPGQAAYGQGQTGQGQYGAGQPGQGQYGQAQSGQSQPGQSRPGQSQPGQGAGYGQQPYGRPQPEYGSAPYSRPPAPGYPAYGGQPPAQPYGDPQGPGQPAPGQSAGAADANADDVTQVFRQPGEEPARGRPQRPSSTPTSSTPGSDATRAHPAPEPDSTQAMPAPGPRTGAQPRTTAPSPADDDPTQAYRPPREEK